MTRDTRCSGHRLRTDTSCLAVVSRSLTQQALDPEFFLTKPSSLIPMQFGIGNETIVEPHRRDTFSLTPTSFAISPSQSRQLANRVPDRDSFDGVNWTDDFEAHWFDRDRSTRLPCVNQRLHISGVGSGCYYTTDIGDREREPRRYPRSTAAFVCGGSSTPRGDATPAAAARSASTGERCRRTSP